MYVEKVYGADISDERKQEEIKWLQERNKAPAPESDGDMPDGMDAMGVLPEGLEDMGEVPPEEGD